MKIHICTWIWDNWWASHEVSFGSVSSPSTSWHHWHCFDFTVIYLGIILCLNINARVHLWFYLKLCCFGVLECGFDMHACWHLTAALKAIIFNTLYAWMAVSLGLQFSSFLGSRLHKVLLSLLLASFFAHSLGLRPSLLFNKFVLIIKKIFII